MKQITWLEYFKEVCNTIISYIHRDRKKDSNMVSGDLSEPFIQSQAILDKINGVNGVGGI